MNPPSISRQLLTEALLIWLPLTLFALLFAAVTNPDDLNNVFSLPWNFSLGIGLIFFLPVVFGFVVTEVSLLRSSIAFLVVGIVVIAVTANKPRTQNEIETIPRYSNCRCLPAPKENFTLAYSVGTVCLFTAAGLLFWHKRKMKINS